MERVNSETLSEIEGLLVNIFALSIRLFVVCVVSFARAVIIVDEEGIPENPLNAPQPDLFPTPPASPAYASQHLSNGMPRTPNNTPTNFGIKGAQQERHYIVFVGRDVGYTTNSVLATSLIHGIPNSELRRFSTKEEASEAYLDALSRGIVYRVKVEFRPNGRREYVSEYLECSSGIRDIVSIQTSANPPYTPEKGKSVAAEPRVQPKNPFSQGDDEIIWPSRWEAVDGGSHGYSRNPSVPSSACSNVFSSGTFGSYLSMGMIQAPAAEETRIITLDSDDDVDRSQSMESSQGSIAQRSTHSSDKYYDSDHEAACIAFIKMEQQQQHHEDGERVGGVDLNAEL